MATKLHNIHRLHRLDPKKTVFMLCDIQEAFRKVMPLYKNLLINTTKLLAAGKELSVPLVVSEQYPEKLGKTAEELDICHARGLIEKTRFSMITPDMTTKLKTIFGSMPQDVVLFGIETHVCVEQTAMDLINAGVCVNLVADCTASRLLQDRDLALERLRHNDCKITTSESVIFNLLKDKNHAKFNDVRKLVTKPSANMCLGYST